MIRARWGEIPLNFAFSITEIGNTPYSEGYFHQYHAHAFTLHYEKKCQGIARTISRFSLEMPCLWAPGENLFFRKIASTDNTYNSTLPGSSAE
jgi:hypothetical protein